MTKEQNLTLLLRILRGELPPPNLDEDSWMELISTAGHQTVTGLLYKAAEGFPEGTRLPDRVLFTLLAKVRKTVSRNLELAQAEKEALGILRSGGLAPLVMKGSTCAARYPSPELRTGGDIDLYIPETDFPKALEVVRAAGIECSQKPDTSVSFILKGCEVELHRRYFDLHVRKAALPPVGTPEAELLMLSAHILKHACSAGVGLRQLCDMALAYARLPYDVQRYRKACEQCGILRWTRMLSSFLNQYLGADAPLFGLPAEDPAPLEKIIRRGGNFGHFEPSRERALSRKPFLRKLDTLGRLLRSVPFALRYAPGETGFLLRTLLKGNIQSLT